MSVCAATPKIDEVIYPPFIELDLERTSVREHVVVRAHTCKDRVHGTNPCTKKMDQRKRMVGMKGGKNLPGARGWNEHPKLSHDLNGVVSWGGER